MGVVSGGATNRQAIALEHATTAVTRFGVFLGNLVKQPVPPRWVHRAARSRERTSVCRRALSGGAMSPQAIALGLATTAGTKHGVFRRLPLLALPMSLIRVQLKIWKQCLPRLLPNPRLLRRERNSLVNRSDRGISAANVNRSDRGKAKKLMKAGSMQFMKKSHFLLTTMRSLVLQPLGLGPFFTGPSVTLRPKTPSMRS